MHHSLTRIPVFDIRTGNFSHLATRAIVHSSGLWHKGIQAFVFSNEKNGREVLVQKRSKNVDIATDKYDQSLAVQLIDSDVHSPMKALYRGLESELALSRDMVEVQPVLQNMSLYISKKYDEHPGVLNNELIKLYFVHVKNKKLVKINCDKIDELIWMKWDDFIGHFYENSDRYTKTLRFYLTVPTIFSKIQTSYENYLNCLTDKGYNKTVFGQRIFFLSHGGGLQDVSYCEKGSKTQIIEYNPKNHFEVEKKRVEPELFQSVFNNVISTI